MPASPCPEPPPLPSPDPSSAAAACLEDHHAERVRDDVVQLPRDPRSLFGDSRARPLLLGQLERSRVVDELHLALAPCTDDAADRKRPAEKHREEREVREADG